MVSSASLVAIAFSALVSLFLPIGTWIFMRRRFKVSVRPIVIGAVIFVVFALILEGAVNVAVIRGPFDSNPLRHRWLFAIYGALAAGLFEETGRLLGFRFMLKSNRQWHDGVAYGIGHGGAEAFLVGFMSLVSNFVLSLLINSGTFRTLGTSAQAIHQLAQVQLTLVHAPSYLFAMAGYERIMAFLIQIALSLLVLRAIQSHKVGPWLLAVVAHAAVDFLAALTQVHLLGVAWVEGSLLLVGVLALWYILWSRRKMVIIRT